MIVKNFHAVCRVISDFMNVLDIATCPIFGYVNNAGRKNMAKLPSGCGSMGFIPGAGGFRDGRRSRNSSPPGDSLTFIPAIG